MRGPTIQQQARADGRAVNWGRQIPESSTLVEAELVSLSLTHAEDITITTLPKQEHQTTNFWPLQVTAGAGGTSTQFLVFPSARGSVFHVCARELIVRVSRQAFQMLDGDGLPIDAPPAAIGCYASLGRPTVSEVKQFTLNPPGYPSRGFSQNETPGWSLNPYSTRARLDARKPSGERLIPAGIDPESLIVYEDTNNTGLVMHTLADFIAGVNLHPLAIGVRFITPIPVDMHIEMIETFER